MGLRERITKLNVDEELLGHPKNNTHEVHPVTGGSSSSTIKTTTTTETTLTETDKKRKTTTTSSRLTTTTILHFDDLPHWARDNAYITTHYRPITNSLKHTLHSLLYLHNESINIYSHLVALLVFLTIPIYLYFTRYEHIHHHDHHHSDYLHLHQKNTDLLYLTPFFVGTTLCLLFSTTFHLLHSHSQQISHFFHTLDYLGIVFMISGSCIPSLYFGLPCHNTLFIFYTGLVLTLGFICIILSLHPHFSTPPYRSLRAAMYVLYGLSGIIPVTHGIIIYGLGRLSKQISLPYMLLQGVLYILGAGIYAVRVPERWWPGSFDLIGASHQIFHFLVVAAAASHLVGLVKAFDYRHGGGGGGGGIVSGLTCEMWGD